MLIPSGRPGQRCRPPSLSRGMNANSQQSHSYETFDLKSIKSKESGVVDPARVTHEAIQNAVSIASTAMTMGALVVDIPEKPVDNQSASMGY